jgi:hypothetical protein
MTHLERTLATLSEAIAAAAAAGPSPLLASLLRRRDAICAALAAPEQACAIGEPHAPKVAVRARERRARAPLAAGAARHARG